MNWKRQTHLAHPNSTLYCRRRSLGLDVTYSVDLFAAIPFERRCQDCFYRLKQAQNEAVRSRR